MADKHVDPRIGNDATADGSMALPYKTPSAAHATCIPGDNVIYHAGGQATGTYYITTTQSLSVDGTAGNPITHKPYVSGAFMDSVIFDGRSGVFTQTAAIFDLGDFITVNGIQWGGMIFQDNATGRGVSVGDDSIVKHLVIHDMGERSIGGGQSRVLIEHNHVYRGGMRHVSGIVSAWPGGIAPFSFGTGVIAADWTITGNYVHDHWGEGIIALRVTGCVIIGNIVHDCYSVGIYVDKAKSTIVDSNYVFYTNPGYNKSGEKMRITNNANESLSIRCGNSETKYRNNIFVGGSVGIRRFQDGANTSNQNYYSDWQIDNNLIYGQDSYAIDFSDVVSPSAEPTGCYFRNNILFKGIADGLTINVASSDRTAWTWQNNIYADFLLTGSSVSFATGTNSFQNQNPNLVSPVVSGSAQGFVLPFTSIANRAGIHIASNTLDYFGKRRNNPPTIGPYEIPAAPTGTADLYYATKNTQLVVAASPSGVLANDYLGLSGTFLNYVPTTSRGASISIDPDTGAFTYNPINNFYGVDTFSYSISNPGGTGVVTSTIIVNNVPPIAVSDAYDATQDVILNVAAGIGVFLNDTLNSGTIAGYATATSRGGIVYLSGSGAFKYTPPAGLFSPPDDTFIYTLINNVGTGSATVSFTISATAAGGPSGTTSGMGAYQRYQAYWRLFKI